MPMSHPQPSVTSLGTQCSINWIILRQEMSLKRQSAEEMRRQNVLMLPFCRVVVGEQY